MPCSAGVVGPGLLPAGAVVHVDLLLAHLTGDRLLLGHRLGTQPHTLHGDGFLGDHRLFGVQHDLLLVLGDAGTGLVAIRLGDRLAFDPDLFVRHRHVHRLLLGGHILAQGGPTGLDLLSTDIQPLLRPGHGFAAAPTGGVANSVRGAGGGPGVGLGPIAGVLGAATAAVPLVVGVQLGRFVDVQMRRIRDVGGVLDHRLLEGHHHVVPVEAGTLQRDELLLGAEQAGFHGDPVGLTGLVVDVDLADGPDLVPLRVDHIATEVAFRVLCVGHTCSLP